MQILLTNDDGILAPGLLCLYDAVKEFGTVHTVAPETPQSAVGHSITLANPLICNTVQLREGLSAWSVDGRPADCVKLAVAELLEEKPDLVVSGINAGANVGIYVIYSGTVAAAIEAALFGIPAVAFSLMFYDKLDFTMAGQIARSVLHTLIENNALQGGVVYTVNMPAPEFGWPKGIKVVRQSTAPMDDKFERRTDPKGRLYFWMNPDLELRENDHQTDVAAVREGYVAVTALRFDLTDRTKLKEMQTWPWLNGELSKPDCK